MITLRSLCLSFAGLILGGCATHIHTDITQNPAPTESFNAFSRFELKPVALGAPYAGSDGNQKAVVKIQQNVDKTMEPILKQWNDLGANAAPARTLLIEPSIGEIKFLNATVRVWTGWMSGSSAVILNVKISDKATGQVIATPTFYARAAAMAGAFSFGAADNAMLIRIAGRLTNYLQANYAHAVGGPSGVDADPVPAKKS